MYSTTITQPQLDLVRTLQHRHKISDAALDAYCVQRFDAPVAELGIRQASQLIDSMKSWKAIPPEIMRAVGQLDLL